MNWGDGGTGGQSHREDYEANLEGMLLRQQGVVDNMIKYLEIVRNRMTNGGGSRTPVAGPGADLPRDPALKSVRRRVTALRTAAQGVAPMEGPMESGQCTGQVQVEERKIHGCGMGGR